MIESLERLQNFVDRMKATSSLNEKKVIIKSIKDDEFIKKVLNYTYDPYKKYYITGKNCKKNSNLFAEIKDVCEDDLFFDLDRLNDRSVTGHDAIKSINMWVNQFPNYANVILSIIDRNLEIRASESVINKVIPDLIPTFDVALAEKYEEKFCNFKTEEWRGSRKLDGVRCIAKKENEEVELISREGNKFFTLNKIIDEIKKIPGNFVLDGEVCMIDDSGKEDFKGIMKEIRRKDHTIENPKYVLFDCLTLEEFDSQKGNIKFSDRLKREPLSIVRNELIIFKHLGILEQILIEDDDQLAKMNNEAERLGFEGTMLRKNIGYEGKRTKNLLKCKLFEDDEYEVVDVGFGEARVIRNGKEVVIPIMAQAYISHKGDPVSVGSGWSQEQRIRYYEHPEELIGKVITVQYFEETKDKNGKISLRFPTVKYVYENGGNV